MRRLKKVVVGLSGGVDSAMVVALLKEQGYDVTGVFLECWRAPGCRTDEDRKDALSVALKLKIPFKVLDFKKEYKQKVVDYFYAEYKAGRTPNPDTMCNREIKFGLFYDWSLKNGFDYVATGHYARIQRIRENPKSKLQISNKSQNPNCKSQIEYKLLRGVDKKKDQSYFLYLLRKDQLKKILFPVGEMTKEEVRREAKKRKLPVADKPDSQGICFIGPVDVKEFLKKKIKPLKGEVVDTKGKVIGKHEGVWFYTIGERHGFKIKPEFMKSEMPALYVVSKDVEKNRLVVGSKKEVMSSEFDVEDVHWINKINSEKLTSKKIKVRIRHGGQLVRAELRTKNKKLKVMLERLVFGVAPGQAAVFYSRDVILGGGVIF